MTTHCRFVCVAALWLAATAPPAVADTLLASFSYDSVGTFGNPVAWQPFISYGNPGEIGAIVMNDATITPITVATGTSFDLTGDLAAFSALATNGIDDAMRIGIFVPGGTGYNATATESSLGVGPPLFAGHTLTRISILGTGFQLTGGADGTEFRTTTQYSFFTNDVTPQPVPLPAAAPMGLACFALFASCRRLRTVGSRLLGG